MPAYAGVACEVLFIVSCPASALARRADEGFHVIEITLERAPTRRSDHVLRLGNAALERLLAQHVLGFLELAGMHAEVTVRRFQQRLEIAEGHPLVYRQGAENPETHPLVNQPVQRHRSIGRGFPPDAAKGNR